MLCSRSLLLFAALSSADRGAAGSDDEQHTCFSTACQALRASRVGSPLAQHCFWRAGNTLSVPSGSLVTLAQHGLAQPERTQLLSASPFVLQVDSLLTRSEIGAIRTVADHIGFAGVTHRGWAGSGLPGSVTPGLRNASTAWCDAACYARPEMAVLFRRARRLTRVPTAHSELQFLRYEEGQFYAEHHDYLSGSERLVLGPRALTLLIYLSDAEGGETVFPSLNISVQPRMGRALLWPSVLDSNTMRRDPRTRHGALAVRSGVKVAANMWLYHRPVDEAHGCTGSSSSASDTGTGIETDGQERERMRLDAGP